jgi:N-acetylglucosamine-6-sulfatase
MKMAFMQRIIAALFLLLIDISAHAADLATRPNILVVITDDQRYDTLGCTGHPVSKTPHIDRMAREGALFRRFYAACPLCSPSRASYLTGVYPHKHGVINTVAKDRRAIVAPASAV